MNIFTNKNILITGGTGSIGQALTRKILEYNPKIVRIFDINESERFNFRNEMKEHISKLRFLIGDVRDRERLNHACENIDIILHLAAMKHVEASEYNSYEAVKTNVIGTQNVIDAAINNNVSKVIFTSSDKAVNPSGVMGTTKLLAEKLITAANYSKGSSKCLFSTVRFGNVMGSSGSVIPLFKKQIKENNLVTITSRDMTRFMMTLLQAVELIVESTEIAQGGEIFIFKMPTINICELAESLFPNDRFITIKTIGIIPGEKLYEELMTNDESQNALERKGMYILLPQISNEYFSADRHSYNAFPITSTNYISKNNKPLSKIEIKKVLIDENLI